MCKGTITSDSKSNPNTPPLHDNTHHHTSSSSSSTTTDDNNDAVSTTTQPPPTTNSTCELCGAEASLYCLPDDAYLCHSCDKWVHGANFLANRHARCKLCHVCGRFTTRFIVRSSKEVRVVADVKDKIKKRKRGRGRRNLFCEVDGNGGGCSSNSSTNYYVKKRKFVFL